MNESLKTMLNENDGCVKSFVYFVLTVCFLSLSVASVFQTRIWLSFVFNSMNSTRVPAALSIKFRKAAVPSRRCLCQVASHHEATTCDNGLPWATTILMTIRIGDLWYWPWPKTWNCSKSWVPQRRTTKSLLVLASCNQNGLCLKHVSARLPDEETAFTACFSHRHILQTDG